jgi:predicted metal-dependent hydrolase
VWLEPAESEWAPALAARARRASEAFADAPLAPPADVRAALGAAARLFDAGLFFEVHEVLEPHWAAARDATREALQGLIQIAVGWQHLANGNTAGARSLLGDGAARLHGRRLEGLDLDAFARATLDAVDRLPDAAPPPFPRLPL